MIKPLEEIRVARDAMELIITLRQKHQNVEWACESCEVQHGHTWRITIVVCATNGLFWRSNIFVAVPVSPAKIAEFVDGYLSQF